MSEPLTPWYKDFCERNTWAKIGKRGRRRSPIALPKCIDCGSHAQSAKHPEARALKLCKWCYDRMMKYA